jgi:hypothetical protein
LVSQPLQEQPLQQPLQPELPEQQAPLAQPLDLQAQQVPLDRLDRRAQHQVRLGQPVRR